MGLRGRPPSIGSVQKGLRRRGSRDDGPDQEAIIPVLSSPGGSSQQDRAAAASPTPAPRQRRDNPTGTETKRRRATPNDQ
eukprot:9239393-Pyramimonas_sp.AAC.1